MEEGDKSLEKVRLNNQTVDAVAYVVVIAAVAPADAGAAKRRRVRQN